MFEQCAHHRLVAKERGLHQRRRTMPVTRIDITNPRQQTPQLIEIAALGNL
jgi:hypothetical protein